METKTQIFRLLTITFHPKANKFHLWKALVKIIRIIKIKTFLFLIRGIISQIWKTITLSCRGHLLVIKECILIIMFRISLYITVWALIITTPYKEKTLINNTSKYFIQQTKRKWENSTSHRSSKLRIWSMNRRLQVHLR